ncbi:MAG: TIGR04423 family type III CRISPR-associated protein, partial [Prevotella sp.]|nr:TIGR04423 family type III CRISPR-associated protein [Prevotella sp.]
MTKIEIKEPCEGYIWKSNSPNPVVYYNEPVTIELDENINPFIVEGYLYVKDKLSYTIKYVDGKYFVAKYELPI